MKKVFFLQKKGKRFFHLYVRVSDNLPYDWGLHYIEAYSLSHRFRTVGVQI